MDPEAIVQAKPGTEFVYHEGELARDRENNPALAAIASQMMRLQQRGYVFLMQRRVSVRKRQYLAIRRQRVA